ncbi:TRAP transporter large permease subunit [Marinovum sp. 2_MG-2023]|uniref:TRAP transporter large permease n=1 Tax=unclassified Marinovum TaxID=2647166 RepID=UPI0026E2A15F|nr:MULTISPECIES: TRAP transporter large permease subunit [unclassified Marinovum]MDO6732895.1 TRAP transporter large permease subunit [Marinovum sp. 2_MG-2023]MDO6782175.1 TRAP transporter large permease subunit [Marinovum sp. 1_MG-2023]
MELQIMMMLGAFFVLLIIGFPVAIAIAVSGFVFGFTGFEGKLFALVPHRIYGVITKYEFIAIPLFVFMGVALERSKIAEDLLTVIGYAMGGLRGGLGIAIVFCGVLLGAATGIVGATIVTLTLLTLPILLQRGYSKSLSCGLICASGTLGQIIPPSLVLILMADIVGLSVGTLFAAAFVPGLLLSALFVVYLLGLAIFKPGMVPAIDAEERAQVDARKLLKQMVVVVLPPMALVVFVLGSIIGGVAAPTEAASIGASGALAIAALYGRLNLKLIRETTKTTLIISSMIFFILLASQVFSIAFRGLGGEHFVEELFAGVPGEVNGAILFLLFIIFVLGFFMEWIEISYIALPIMLPFFQSAGVDMVWLAMLIAVILQTSFLTPPFGWSLFFLQGVAPPEIRMKDIYIGVMPFIGIQLLVVALVFLFSDIVLWLPRVIGW